MKSNASRDEKITALYAAHALKLVRTVAAAGVDYATAEDACAFAWAQLVRSTTADVDRPEVIGWLRVVATREAHGMLSRHLRGEWLADDEMAAAVWAVDSSSEADEFRATQEMVGELPERQRRLIWLAAIGFSMDEMAERTGDTVRTVERQLYRARKTLRGKRSEQES